MMKNVQSEQLRILVVDDEESTLDLYHQVLAPEKNDLNGFSELGELVAELFGKKTTDASPRSPFELVMCRQGDEAVEAVKKSLEENQHFAVVFLDVRMPPGPDGVWAAEQIRAADPHIELVIVTGYSDLHPRDIAHRVPPPYKLLYLQKPFHSQEIYQFASTLGTKWRTECELRKIHAELEMRIAERTAELRQANEQLEEEKERHRIVLEAAPDPVVVYDMEGKVTYLNPAFSRVFGWTLSESIGRDIDFVPVEKLSETSLISTKLESGESILGIETCRLTRDGEKVAVSISGAGFFDNSAKLQGCVITLQDITGRKKTEQEIKFLAYHDLLTGLPNRKSFYMDLENELARSHSRNGEERRTSTYRRALLFLDLDKFKDVNDTLGHDAGDELLKLVAVRIQDCLRTSDHVFRLGGDEFTIILNDLTNDIDVAKVVTKLRETVARSYWIKGHELYLTVSIGISVYPDDGDNVETLVKNADMAMYAAKREQEGYRFFTEEINMKTLERMKLESSLRNALQQEQLTLFYQSLMDTNNCIVGIEALIRWQHPELGMLNPSRFIPLAEETGVITSIGHWVLHTACRQAKKWHDTGHTGIYVAINLSTRQFKEPDLLETVEQVLEVTGLPPGCLKLEVTESGVMEKPEQAIAKMKMLRAKGIHFSIDDFGTGYSSLSYLKRFQIDTLKIDRSFVVDSINNKDDREIIKTIIAMARNLGMDTVAEGVETKEQRDFLVRQGCHIMQGYYFGRPMPSEQFEEMLQTRYSAKKTT
ncbi:MAG: EAL domain-containing protein [bacterium]|nr:EAL domain-containing protein [bacterium]